MVEVESVKHATWKKQQSLQKIKLLFTERQKVLKNFCPRTWSTKHLPVFGVIHQGCSLMSCPGQRASFEQKIGFVHYLPTQ